MNLFQSLVLAVFGLFAIAAVVIFSLTTSGGTDIGFAGTFKLWGTLPASSMEKPLEDFNNANSKLYRLEYVERRKDSFQNDLISALAAGNGPDLVILPETSIVQNSDKILPISYDSYAVRDFNDNFIDGASLFMSKDGIFGMPLYLDPLVMYWNKDIFSTGGVASYPTKWSEFENLAGRLTISNRGGNISQATVAMGSYFNVEHVKDILATLFMQSGSEIVRFTKSDEFNSTGDSLPYIVSFGGSDDDSALESALRFFLGFSDPNKKAYSWNVAMANSKSAFSGGILGVYFGHASDYGSIQKNNPHLNFDVAVIPQRDAAKNRITFGNIYGVSITRVSKNPIIAKQIAINMSGADFTGSLSREISLPPARRDLLSAGAKDPIASVFYSSAIISRAWLDPVPAETYNIFRDLTESVLSGVKTDSQAIRIVRESLTNLIKKK
jgi:ABC-type glycerol-3-phosphate transport system substrate-binding protein